MERFDDADVPGVKEVALDKLGAFVNPNLRASSLPSPILHSLTHHNHHVTRADNGKELEEHLRALTRHKFVPYVFVAGKPVAEPLAALRSPATALRASLEAAGAKPTGYFRA